MYFYAVSLCLSLRTIKIVLLVYMNNHKNGRTLLNLLI